MTDLAAIEALAPAWRELADGAARAPLDSPDWLLPIARRYLRNEELRFLTWWAADQLVGVAPLTLVVKRPRLRPLRELTLWGSTGPRMRGLGDVVARAKVRKAVVDSLSAWLATNGEWDVASIIRPQHGSITPRRLRRRAAAAGWSYLTTASGRSTTYQLDLPANEERWEELLGAKKRKAMRWEVRKFGELHGGTIETISGGPELGAAIDAVERLLRARWGESEVYFTPDPTFRPFVHEAVRAMAGHGAAWVTVARDESGIQGGLISLAQNGWAMALTIAITNDERYRPLSLGKNLFEAGLREAIRRGCHTYDFLWQGEYKQQFWGAQPRHLETAVVGRGLVGKLAAQAVARRL